MSQRHVTLNFMNFFCCKISDISELLSRYSIYIFANLRFVRSFVRSVCNSFSTHKHLSLPFWTFFMFIFEKSTKFSFTSNHLPTEFITENCKLLWN